MSEPLSLYVDTHGTGTVADDKLEDAIRSIAKLGGLTPRGIREHLQLNKPIYQRTAAYGHCGRKPEADGGFSWEKTDLAEALDRAAGEGRPATHFVIGLAPDGGRLPRAARIVVEQALRAGLHVDSGLHDFLSEDASLAELAKANGVRIRDVRRPPDRSELHFFSGVIEAVGSTRIALLGTDSAVGKRTTAWKIVEGLEARGRKVEMIGTGQTAWMQGARYSIVLDSLINDFVAGEIEHAVWTAWREQRPDVIVIEGQGSLMNPAYPGGFELLAAGRPDVVVMQHAPGRKEYDGFPGYPIQPLDHQIKALEVISGKPVVAVTVNHEDLTPDGAGRACKEIEALTGRPAFDVLSHGADGLISALAPYFGGKK